jgi:hypothetical protein
VVFDLLEAESSYKSHIEHVDAACVTDHVAEFKRVPALKSRTGFAESPARYR